MNVQIPVKWVQELLALCGPEDHELRERVMVSITAMNEQAAGPVVTPEPDAAIKEVMELVGAAMDSAMKAGELLLDSHEKFNAQFASAKSLKNSIESKLRALLATATGLPAQATETTHADFEAWWGAAGDGRSKMLAKRAWTAATRAAAPQAQADARDAQPLIARQLGEWHEDDGPVAWWAWCGHEWAGEPAWIGTPLSDNWPDYHTHWTPHPELPAIRAAIAAAKGEGQ